MGDRVFISWLNDDERIVSGYVRVNLLNPSIEMKLNRIMDMLETNKSGEKNGKSK